MQSQRDAVVPSGAPWAGTRSTCPSTPDCGSEGLAQSTHPGADGRDAPTTRSRPGSGGERNTFGGGWGSAEDLGSGLKGACKGLL